MTAPTPPAEPTEPSTTQEPTEPATGQQQTSTSAEFDPSTLSPEAQAYLKQQMEAAGFKARDNARTKAAEEARQQLMAEFAKTLGLAGGDDGAPSAEDLATHLESAQSDAYRTSVENQILRLAGRAGVDAEALLDSNSAMDAFLAAIDENEGAADLDPRSREFGQLVEAALAKAAERNPRIKAGGATGPTGPRPDPSQGARGGAAPDMDTQIAEAQKAGQWGKAIALKNQKLAALAAQQK